MFHLLLLLYSKCTASLKQSSLTANEASTVSCVSFEIFKDIFGMYRRVWEVFFSFF